MTTTAPPTSEPSLAGRAIEYVSEFPSGVSSDTVARHLGINGVLAIQTLKELANAGKLRMRWDRDRGRTTYSPNPEFNGKELIGDNGEMRCPYTTCTYQTLPLAPRRRGKHVRKRLIEHLVKCHKMERDEATSMADRIRTEHQAETTWPEPEDKEDDSVPPLSEIASGGVVKEMSEAVKTGQGCTIKIPGGMMSKDPDEQAKERLSMCGGGKATTISSSTTVPVATLDTANDHLYDNVKVHAYTEPRPSGIIGQYVDILADMTTRIRAIGGDCRYNARIDEDGKVEWEAHSHRPFRTIQGVK